jgi:hypothetical protein
LLVWANGSNPTKERTMTSALEQTLRERATRGGARVAALAAGGIAVVMVAQQMVQTVTSALGGLAYGGLTAGYYGPNGIADVFVPFFGALGLSIIPVAIGAFVSFWLVGPIAAGLRLATVLLRSVIAAAVASFAVLVASLAWSVVFALATAGPLTGNSFPRLDVDASGLSFIGNLQNALWTFGSLAPLVVLAGVLVWLRVSRHPADSSSVR